MLRERKGSVVIWSDNSTMVRSASPYAAACPTLLLFRPLLFR